jgi:hypothetical protein
MPRPAPKRRVSKGADPLLLSNHWRVVVRGYWVRNARACARCGRPLDTRIPRYYPGTRKVHPGSLVVGHIVGRDQAKLLGWKDEQINAITNTQPEHARCSDRSGAQYGNQKRGRRGAQLRVVPREERQALDNSRRW